MTVRTSSLHRGAVAGVPAWRGPLLLLLLVAVVAAAVGGLTLRGSPGHSNSPAYRFSQTRIEGTPTMYSLLSENGAVVTFLQDGQIWAQQVAGGPRTLVTADLAGQPSGPFDYPFETHIPVAISPSGRLVVFASPAKGLTTDPPATPNPSVPPDWYDRSVFVRDIVAGTTRRISPLTSPDLGTLWLWLTDPLIHVPSAKFLTEDTLNIYLSFRIPPAVIPSPDPWEPFGWEVRLDLPSLRFACPGSRATGSARTRPDRRDSRSASVPRVQARRVRGLSLGTRG